MLARGAGGYSGPALKPIALACVWACAAAVELPIVGMGGIFSAEDASDFVSAGASAIALGTALFTDPFSAPRIRAGLAALDPEPVLTRGPSGHASATVRGV